VATATWTRMRVMISTQTMIKRMNPLELHVIAIWQKEEWVKLMNASSVC